MNAIFCDSSCRLPSKDNGLDSQPWVCRDCFTRVPIFANKHPVFAHLALTLYPTIEIYTPSVYLTHRNLQILPRPCFKDTPTGCSQNGTMLYCI